LEISKIKPFQEDGENYIMKTGISILFVRSCYREQIMEDMCETVIHVGRMGNACNILVSKP
jgi:hypothetical protein